MKKIKVLIADDEPLARERIRDLLELEKDISIAGECCNGIEAVSKIQSMAPDLIFLDIQMPGLDGIGVLEVLDTDKQPFIIFVTAYDQYALQAFEVHALDYLLKPFDRGRFNKALDQARHHIKLNNNYNFNIRTGKLLNEMKNKNKYPDRFTVKRNGKFRFVNTSDIKWIEAAGNYLLLHSNNKEHIIRETMDGIEKKLDPEQFFRSHRSTIVRIGYINEIRTIDNGEYEIVLKNGKYFSVSRKYRKNIKQFCFN